MANGKLFAKARCNHVSRFTHHVSMKILPPADENERQALKLRMERALGQEQGSYWRVDIIAGRYGWYVRPVRLRTRTSGGQNVLNKRGVVSGPAFWRVRIGCRG
jgi:hypothetical protein